MHVRFTLVLVCCLLTGGIASAQSLQVQASAGPTLIDEGYSLAAGVGITWPPRLTLTVNVDRTHLSTRIESVGPRETFAFRGGTLTMASAELRVSVFGRDRVSPYGLAGLGLGLSVPNVSDRFPEVPNRFTQAVFAGGGLQVPLGDRLSAFADIRMMLGVEETEVSGFVPVRAGVAWRF